VGEVVGAGCEVELWNIGVSWGFGREEEGDVRSARFGDIGRLLWGGCWRLGGCGALLRLRS